MRGFFNKLKRSNKVLLTIYLIGLISYIISLVFFTRSLLLLRDIETLIRMIVLGLFYVIGMLYLVFGLVCLFTKRMKTLLSFSIFIVLLVGLFSVGTIYINRFYESLGGLQIPRITLKTHLIVFNGTEINNNSRLGIIAEEEDSTTYYLANRLIEYNELDNEIIIYDDYFEMLADLAEEKIDGAFFPNNYEAMFGNIEILEDIMENIQVVLTYSKEFDNDELAVDLNLNEPFSVLLLGMDETGNADAFMVLTYNPQTLSVTMLSIPRDLYVRVTCFGNNFTKINASGSRVGCAIDTIQQLMGIDIDFYVRINFNGLVDLVDALGGITVDVSEPDFRFNRRRDCRRNDINMICGQDSQDRWGREGQYTIWIEPGENRRLDGEQALQYTRNRFQFRDGDIARGRHQQLVLNAVANELISIRNVNDLFDILNIVTYNTDTNLTTNQILSFYNVGRDILSNMRVENPIFNIQRMQLEIYDLRVFLPRARSHTWALGHFEDSLDAIIDAKKVNLGLAEAELIKTISFSVNEPFEVRPIGRGLRSGSRLELMPNLTGQTVEQVQAWARERDINVNVQNVTAGQPGYDPSIASGRVVSQSIHQNELVIIQTQLTIRVIHRPNNVPTPNPPVTTPEVPITTTTSPAPAAEE